MIGRRALADQWIFRDALSLLQSGEIPPPPSRQERVAKMVRHFDLMVERLGERSGVIQFRKRVSWYVKTIGPCPAFRRQTPYISSVAEFERLVDELLTEIDRRDSPDSTGVPQAPSDPWSADEAEADACPAGA
jgi:tRNA-dihydrouridine synthase